MRVFSLLFSIQCTHKWLIHSQRAHNILKNMKFRSIWNIVFNIESNILSYTSYNSVIVNIYSLVILCPLLLLSLHRLSSNYSLSHQLKIALLPSACHHWLESSCGDSVWTRLTLVLIWTLELCQAAREGSWPDWKDPFLGCCSACSQLFLSCLFAFSQEISYTFHNFSHVCYTS